jgi:pilus assembly protein CpaE
VPLAANAANVLEPDVVVVVADDSVARPVAAIQALNLGESSWTVVALAERFEREFVRQAMLAGARDVLVRGAPSGELRQAVITARELDRARRTPSEDRSAHAAGSLIAVTGVKGGIGKTTVAVNLALALALETDRSVALVDLDLPYGDIAMLLNLKPERNVLTAMADPATLANPDLLLAHTCTGPAGLQVLAAPLNGDGANLDTARIAPLLTQLANLYDFVVVDTAPGFGELTAAPLDIANQTLLVTTPEPPTLRRTELGLHQLQEWKYPATRLKVVLNRATLRSGLRVEEIDEVLSQPIAWWLPDEASVVQSLPAGQPLLLAEPKSHVARSVRAMARQLGGVPEQPRKPFWPIFRRSAPLALARA